MTHTTLRRVDARRLSTARAAALAVGAVLFALIAGVVAYLLWPAEVPSFETVKAGYLPSDGWLLDRSGRVLDSKRLRFDVRRSAWVPLDEISPALVDAIIEGEDRRFWAHGGIDAESLGGAIRDALWHHRRRGASTLAMQVVSLLEHRRRDRSFEGVVDKLEQMRLARSLARRWTRPQILEAYLNLLEYQGELQGIGAASAVLAGKSPAGLSRAESLVLAALLPQPAAGTSRIAERACARLLHADPRSAHEVTPLTCDGVRATAHRLLDGRGGERGDPGAPARRGGWGSEAGPLPEEHLAPPLAQALLTHPGEQYRTTLDADLQRRTLDILSGHLRALAEHNARDGAALIADNATGEVLAYVGSAGPHSRARQIDGVRALRQAGSTLKPFLYELALERRYLTPASLLADSPLSLDTASGVYLPQDYDHDFKGLVSVRTALGSSLNVPAVRTLVLIGIEPFRNRLLDLGYRDIKRDGEYYGYSLALGSAEVTLWQQAQAYLALARGGDALPLTLAPAHGAARPRPVLAADASFLIGDILSDPAARALTFGLANHLDTPVWTAVKTGTSEDMRDNWCIGFSRRYTVAVWVGNFEGDSMHDVSGVTGAAPVWHDLMAMLHTGSESRPPPAPATVAAQLVSFSPSVEPARSEWFLAGTQPGGGTEPGEGTGLGGGTGPAARRIAAVPAATRPGIESPANGMVIALDPDIPLERQRVLISVRGAGPHMTLKLNDRALGPADSTRLWEPRAGSWYLSLEDAGGRQLDRVLFTVRDAGG